MNNYLLILSCILTILSFFPQVIGFNIDTKYASIFEDPERQLGSYFGFSVALRRASPGTGWNSWLLVGAPRANSTLQQYANIHQPGVVYQCRLQDGQSLPGSVQPCSLLNLDSKGNEKGYGANGFNYHHNKNDAWIGASLDVEDEENGMVVACGPKWINQYYEHTYLMNGICYLYDKGSFMTKDARVLLPLLEKKKQVFTIKPEKEGENETKAFYYAFGGAGISAQIIKSQNRSELIIGAPGIFDWKGSTVRYRDSPQEELLESNSRLTELIVANPGYISSIEYIGYFGFSVGASNFFPNNARTYYVSGAPRAADYRGKVTLYAMPENQQEDMSILRELIGQQMGEYFGASICVADVTGDGKPDLIVGAPSHSLPFPQGDEGRIYVFINDLISPTQGDFRAMGESGKIMGTQQYGARFGTTVVNIGDINLDGHEDIVVGAPYEDEGRGAIYIYHGRKNGINQKFAQRISARELSPSIKGFGIGVSRGVDIDQNSYSDFAVGAYTSGHAVVFRSHPVISFHGSIKTNVERITFNATGFNGRACIFYTGKKAPYFIHATVTVQVDPVYKRAQIVTKTGKSSSMTFNPRLKLEEPICQNFTIEIKAMNQDFSKPIDIQMSADIDNSKNVRAKRQADDNFCKSCPVVDPNNLNIISSRVPYTTGCKQDDVCKTDLIVTTSIPKLKPPIVIGSINNLEVEVSVKNQGEPAFLSQVLISIPRTTPLMRVPQTCGEIRTEDGPINLKCDIGNPLAANEKAIIPLQLDMKSLPSGTRSLDIKIKSMSAGDEQNEKNNAKNLTIALVTSADIAITGKSVSAHYSVDWHNKTKKPDNVTFTHTFEVVNYGPSPVDQVRVVITLPFMITRDKSINFVSVYNPRASLDGKYITCSMNGGQYHSDDLVLREFHDAILNGKQNRRIKRNANKELEFDGQIPVNRTLFVNCSQPDIQCMTVECNLGPLRSSQNVATISFKMRADVQKIEHLIDDIDVVLLSSKGTTTILSLPSSVQPESHRPDEVNIHTMFLAKLPEGKVQSWWIILAIILGILILLLIILALVKMGFFKRNKKAELDALKHKQLIEDEFGDE